MDKNNETRPLKEGMIKKGGLNHVPTSSKPTEKPPASKPVQKPPSQSERK